MEQQDFEDIRPYRDSEIPAAMSRIAESTSFPLLASYVFPDMELNSVKEKIKSIRTTEEFQTQVMFYMNQQIISRTITEFTYAGLEHLQTDQKYLFIGNHRDIVLDSSLMQYVLYNNGHETSEITFGANLMQGQLIIDIGKSNKMFKVERPTGNPKEFYRASLHLSQYIRHVICEKHQSIWIAQRNGRTKDGIDLTEQGIIKMFGMSGKGRKSDALAELHIAPVAISYEWEPCDILKTLELYERRQLEHYIKKPGEDVNSILTGIVQPKGKVHIEFCKPLTIDELSAYDPLTAGDFHRRVARLIDERIHRSYRLTPNNYIAYDLQHGTSEHSDRYTEEQQSAFISRLRMLQRYEESCDLKALTDIFMGIYSNPVSSKSAQKNEESPTT
ncbi:MAG: acyltransferase [Bacteroides sp.]|nr:acyltransferase [Bacteroides sp.]